MGDFSFEEGGYPRIYTIHSQKGGVGKTSIALALAGMTGALGKKTLIIDGDMTGASIADVPGITCNRAGDYNELILATPNEFCAVAEVWPPRKRNESTELETRFCQEQTDHKGVYVIPSSARAEDVERIVPLISQEDHLHFFRYRTEDILVAAIRSGFETIILDHSPGMFGFSKTNLQMCLEWALKGLKPDRNEHRLDHLLKGYSRKPSLHAFLVSSFEPHDYKSVLTSFQYLVDRLKEGKRFIENDRKHRKALANSFRFIFNKATVDDSVPEVEKMFNVIDNLSQYLTETIRGHEIEFGVQLAPLVEGFGMGDIWLNAENFVFSVKESGKPPSGKWGKWLSTIACRAHLIHANDISDAGIVR
jgi:cellulose biosynthesis protein BcsQ